jgi:hypothetical protein
VGATVLMAEPILRQMNMYCASETVSPQASSRDSSLVSITCEAKEAELGLGNYKSHTVYRIPRKLYLFSFGKKPSRNSRLRGIELSQI